MSLGGHLDELRKRVMWCVLAFAAAFVLCWVFRQALWDVLIRPHVHAMRAYDLDPSLHIRTYFEVVVPQLKAFAICAALLTAPMIIYHVWAFVAPGLFLHERHRVLKIGAACIVCFIVGVVFAYFVLVPIALECLIGLSTGWAKPVMMVDDYLSTFFMLTFITGLAFQTPVIVYFLIRWGIISVESMQRYRKPMILGAFIIAAIITPTVDPITETLVAGTLILLYDVGSVVAAPTRSTVLSFARFTGGIVILGLAFGGWYMYWPVGEASALKGTVTVAGREVSGSAAARITRGALCRTDEGSAARIAFRGKGAPVVYLAGNARVQVHGSGDLSLFRGDSLVTGGDKKRDMVVHTGPASVMLTGTRAQLSVPDEDTLTVTVFEGQALVTVAGETKRIAAGQTATFRRGGEPADVSGAEQRWRDIIGQGR
jgi:Tat protein translocase TatC